MQWLYRRVKWSNSNANTRGGLIRSGRGIVAKFFEQDRIFGWVSGWDFWRSYARSNGGLSEGKQASTGRHRWEPHANCCYEVRLQTDHFEGDSCPEGGELRDR